MLTFSVTCYRISLPWCALKTGPSSIFGGANLKNPPLFQIRDKQGGFLWRGGFLTLYTLIVLSVCDPWIEVANGPDGPWTDTMLTFESHPMPALLNVNISDSYNYIIWMIPVWRNRHHWKFCQWHNDPESRVVKDHCWTGWQEKDFTPFQTQYVALNLLKLSPYVRLRSMISKTAHTHSYFKWVLKNSNAPMPCKAGSAKRECDSSSSQMISYVRTRHISESCQKVP